MGAKGEISDRRVLVTTLLVDLLDVVINLVVATHTRAEVVGEGKLKSTDGVYGMRFGHNTDATVMDFKKTKAQ